MNIPAVCLGSLALASGVSVASRRALEHARSIQNLLASIDHKLAHELSKYAVDINPQDAQNAVLWQQVGGLVGIVCLIHQARLWRNIVQKIRKHDPTRFEIEGVSVNKHYGALWFAVALAILETGFRFFRPTLPRVNGGTCVRLFSEIAATAEEVIIKVDSRGSCESVP